MLTDYLDSLRNDLRDSQEKLPRECFKIKGNFDCSDIEKSLEGLIEKVSVKLYEVRDGVTSIPLMSDNTNQKAIIYCPHCYKNIELEKDSEENLYVIEENEVDEK